ncbi:MAG TPA: FHA domain-containing protein, partial [Kofleriaceae bacterium]
MTGTLSGQLFRVTKGHLTIGRSPHVELRLDDDGISRNHARIRSETPARAIPIAVRSTNEPRLSADTT